jgi:hypothetical protein
VLLKWAEVEEVGEVEDVKEAKDSHRGQSRECSGYNPIGAESAKWSAADFAIAMAQCVKLRRKHEQNVRYRVG